MPTVNTPTTPRELQEQRFRTARVNLGLMIVLTIANIVLLLTGSDTMLLFSATIPYFTSILAYTAVEYGLAANMTLFLICAGIAAISILLYALCWLLSKKHPVWMTVALVLFGLDTAFLAFLYISEQNASGILDILIHVWVIYYLVLGIISSRKLKMMPQEPKELPADDEQPADTPQPVSSTGLYPADTEGKCRVLAEAEAAGHHIVYRRIKHVNELVIDGYVYDTYEALVEVPHTLTANRNGVVIEVGTDATSHIFICVDGERIFKKLRVV